MEVGMMDQSPNLQLKKLVLFEELKVLLTYFSLDFFTIRYVLRKNTIV